MLISIVIVSWNGKDYLWHCLNSLKAQTDQEFEIIIVDNASNDGTQDFIREVFPEVTLCQLENNLGFAEGCNRGIDHASGSWIAMLNQDTTVEPDWLTVLKEYAQTAGSDIGMIQSRLLFLDKPQMINSTGIELSFTADASDRDYMVQASMGAQEVDIFCPTAAAALYRREMLDQVRLKTGFFDRTFFMYWEDIDLGWRCQLAGWKAVYIPTATCFHHFQGSAKSKGRTFIELQCRKNRLRALLKNGSFNLIYRVLKDFNHNFNIGRKRDGFGSLNNLFSAVYDGLSQRRHVSKLVKIERQKLESKWINHLGKETDTS